MSLIWDVLIQEIIDRTLAKKFKGCENIHIIFKDKVHEIISGIYSIIILDMRVGWKDAI